MTDTTPNPPHRNNKKIILIVIGVIFVLCIISCGVAYFSLRGSLRHMVQTTPGQTKAIASQIADFDLPDGYHDVAGTTIFGIQEAIYTDKTEKNYIMLIQSPSSGGIEPENILTQALAKQKGNSTTWTQEDIQIFTIRGEKSSVTIFSGVDKDGVKYHAWTGKFPGKSGTALFIIEGLDATLDAKVAEDFIKSLR
jgi:hypothetical protein